MLVYVTKGNLSSDIQLKKYEKCIFSIYSFNMDISFNMSITVMDIYVLIIDTIMERTFYQFYYLGPNSYLMQCRK